ncbi:MAG: U32 family peptidase [Ruminococcaceae bacterium]|nr:U32 family peptidase [Oscillospiraceae bacterium]
MPELLSPAGNFEKMKAAILYGADAVYLAGNEFGMRAAADNFTFEELCEAVKYAHERNVKVYLTLNTMPRTTEYPRLRAFLDKIKDIGLDAFIVADIGVISLCKELAPNVQIHISTQASVVSAQTCTAFQRMGATRIVLSRELSFSEIKAIRSEISKELELEAFIHGAMCVAYSGRCLLSNHFVGRDGNRGACAQPCRWNYKLYEAVEEKRLDDRLGIMQTEHGTFTYSSRDLCMIEHIPELCESGIDSFKIEGRMKSAYYAAVVTNTYRMAIDKYYASPLDYKYDPVYMNELCSVSHREYDTGFFFDDPMSDAKVTEFKGYIREKAYLATVLSCDENGVATLVQRNKLIAGQSAEILSPGKTGQALTITELYNESGEPIESAPHPGMIFTAKLPFAVKPGDILRGGGE